MLRLVVSILIHGYLAYFLATLGRMVLDNEFRFPAIFLGSLILGLPILVLLLISSVWRNIQSPFSERWPISGRRYWAVRMVVEWTRFCVNVTVGDAGIRVAAIPAYRLFHPPIYIPWSAVMISHPNSKSTVLEFPGHEIPPVRIACFFDRGQSAA
ncbi:MAG: hypothetical protein IT428_16030 [Planctomycetaceae bacterium]|nr:hypothetical protein [Planctomycetaceae bacterium]